MSSSDFDGYCSFTKAIEHLGDRWTLLIVREIGMFGPQGFSALARGLPRRISRSVLANRLRKLQDLGLVARSSGEADQEQYQLSSAGNELLPTILWCSAIPGW